MLPLLHQDDALLAVDKPAGLLCVPGRGADKQDCAIARVQRQFPEALVVHRLDMATSGLVLFARGERMQRMLSMAFADRAVHKRYVAVVHGQPRDDAGEIALPLLADWPRRPRQKVDPLQGKPALTRWRVLARDEGAGTARLALEPVTGRSHQLRVHLLSIGHPIVGDGLYGAPDGAPRMMLHAQSLELPHPRTAQRLSLCSRAPF